jgi:selenide,water dikinase
VFQLSAEVTLVQTVDFFAPIVDDPFEFGQIAAANALSDIYAMGGAPLTALSIVGFPSGTLPLAVLTEILRGGQEKVHEAGASVIGGHSIIDDEVKYGLAVTGRVDPTRMLTNAGAHAGESLVLTKALGTGFVTTALKRNLLGRAEAADAITSMRTLNAAAADAAVSLGVRCATDVTGFGLLGHAAHIARASGVTLAIAAGAAPVLPGAEEAWRANARPGGAERNEAWLRDLVDWGDVQGFRRDVLIDPQTSGGLLASVPADRLAEYLSRAPGAVLIGSVLPRGARPLVLV